MLLALGLFVFEMGTLPFSELERRRAWRWGVTERVGTRPASQYLGPGDDQVRIEGQLYPQVGGNRSSLETLAEMADEGQSWTLVDGTGRVFGQFKIDGIDTRGTVLYENGVPRRTDFSIELARVA